MTVGSVVVRESRIESNSAEFPGGGIYAYAASFEVEHSIISDNTAEGGGGGISLHESTVALTSTRLLRNVSVLGGGLRATNSFTSENGTMVEITNCLFSENEARDFYGTGHGGAIDLGGDITDPVVCKISSSTVTRNAGRSAISATGTDVTVVNSIVYSNARGISFSGATIAASYSNIEGGLPGEGNIDLKPRFLEPGDYRLSCESPCIDAGSDDLAGELPELDLEGGDLRRIGPIDMGADEVGAHWSVLGILEPGGSLSFSASAPLSQGGLPAEIFVSFGDGSRSGGISVPGAGERQLMLDEDGLFRFWSSQPPSVRTLRLKDCSTHATTAPFRVPGGVPIGTEVYFAGITRMKSGGADVVSVSPTRSFVVGSPEPRTWHVDVSSNSCPGEGTPSSPLCRLQLAIDLARDGDTILVAPGTYAERMDFLGKAVTVRSTRGPAETVIDGEEMDTVVKFVSGEGESSILSGFTIRGGNASLNGGGILCTGSSPGIESCWIVDNRAGGQAPIGRGGGIACLNASPTIMSSVIARNVVPPPGEGGGLYISGGHPRIANTTIVDNQAHTAGGIRARISELELWNSIVWGNLGGAFECTGCTERVRTCNIEGGYPGPGNFSSDPQFLSNTSVDHRLACNSPCVDAGTDPPGIELPELDDEGRERRIIGRIDVGADEVGTFWELEGPAQPGGPPARFLARAAPAQSRDLAEVYLSLGDGKESGGIVVPGSGSRRLELDPDSLFRRWSTVSADLRRAALDGCSPGAATSSFVIPESVPVGLRVYFAGVSWRFHGPAKDVVSVTRTRSFDVQ